MVFISFFCVGLVLYQWLFLRQKKKSKADVLIPHFNRLVKVAGHPKFKQKLIEKHLLTDDEIQKICSQTNDERHHRRLLIFALNHKKVRNFFKLIQLLEEIEENSLANDLKSSLKAFVGSTPFCFHDLALPDVPSLPPLVNCVPKLTINVNLSKMFYDSPEYNPDVAFYTTRSKNRGHVLIINNYIFDVREERRGSVMDAEKLEELFNQMGCRVDSYSNKTGLEMARIIKNFADDKSEAYDCYFVFIMSHGTERMNESYMYSTDDEEISQSEIENYFYSLFPGKPKTLIYQVCRGSKEVFPGGSGVEKDSSQHEELLEELVNKSSTHRLHEDMVVVNSTVHGYCSYRLPDEGSFYIYCLCIVFMKHAHEYTVNKMLTIVDQNLKRKALQYQCDQTSDIRYLGFKELYLHPGIYMDDGQIKSILDKE